MTKDWEQIAQKYRHDLYAKIPKEWRIFSNGKHDAAASFLSPNENQIISSPGCLILEQLKTGAITAVEVVGAICHAAAIAHQLTNCLSDIRFDEALERARELDHQFRIHGKPAGPLHGLPVSLKDSIQVKGSTAAMGLVALAQERSSSDSKIVDYIQGYLNGHVLFL